MFDLHILLHSLYFDKMILMTILRLPCLGGGGGAGVEKALHDRTGGGRDLRRNFNPQGLAPI